MSYEPPPKLRNLSEKKVVHLIKATNPSFRYPVWPVARVTLQFTDENKFADSFGTPWPTIPFKIHVEKLHQSAQKPMTAWKRRFTRASDPERLKKIPRKGPPPPNRGLGHLFYRSTR